jgi:hypothetical protein
MRENPHVRFDEGGAVRTLSVVRSPTLPLKSQRLIFQSLTLKHEKSPTLAGYQ